MSESAARGPATAPGGLAVKSKSAPGAQSTVSAQSAASHQGGYLTKLFGLGSGTAPSVGDRTPAIDETHDYHPGTL